MVSTPVPASGGGEVPGRSIVMAYAIHLHNPSRDVDVEVVPCHGGMIGQITCCGKELLHLDRGVLETAPMAAGGMPVLFPFPSKTADDCYRLNGASYHMPMHGLVKNSAFAVSAVSEDSVTLWMESSPAWMAACYPFDFRMELTYRVEGRSVFTTAAITNRSGTPMPHTLGWHPFFKCSDKHRIQLTYHMKTHYDYVACRDLPAPEALDLSTRLDDVFHTGGGTREFVLQNQADGYVVRCVPDPAFDVLVVCSWVEDSMCVEPWCGLPNSINNGRFLAWIAPGATQTYTVEYRLEGDF